MKLKNNYFYCFSAKNTTRHDLDTVLLKLSKMLLNMSMLLPIGSFYICGDFNARCGEATDFIEGVDNLPIRTALDFTHNAYSDVFIDFLINVNCCIVNGRNSIQDDFTYVSTRGSSVVDYCLVPYENQFIYQTFFL